MQGREVVVAQLGPLTPREAQALLWVAEGKTAWEAGTILGITEATTNAHIASAAIKLQASNRAHLITRAFVTGILSKVVPIIALLAVLVQSCSGDMDDARLSVRPVRRRRDDYHLEAPRSVA